MTWTHTYPLNDLIEHQTGDSPECVCDPKVDFDLKLVIHNSLDRREIFEQKEQQNED